jgi:hypothetical protein
MDRRLPSWDQADYLNSALDHGRALGLIPPGGGGWRALLDLSPKIPPLASLVNGSVMAIAGDQPDQASWALSVWHALLLVVVACWGRQLLGRGFGLLCATLLLLVPALAHLRVDFTLDLPVAASASLALWLLGRWQAPEPMGGRWGQMLPAALAVAAALLVKQSSLLLLAGPVLWASVGGLRRRGRRLQVVLGALLVLALLLPWLQHNWITTLGGTNRAVLESAAAEGDPPMLSWASLSWYARGLPAQLGLVLPLPLLALALVVASDALRRGQLRQGWGLASSSLSHGWAWLVGCALSGWLLTTLSPNKDPRYITAVLPLLVILLALAWWEIGWRVRRRWGRNPARALLLAGVAAATGQAIAVAAAQIHREEPAPVAALTERLRQRVGDRPITLVVVPGNPELNEQTVTTFGRLSGGRIEGRRLGRARREHPLVLERSQWLLLATGDQGTDRPFSKELSHRVRADSRFARVAAWPWSHGREVELWERRATTPAVPFDGDFIRLARGMERGPAGLGALFARIGPEHQLDAHFQYQERVRHWALERLRSQPKDADALWSLALVATLRNRPLEAEQWFASLQGQHPHNPWPLAYRAVVLLASWNPFAAHAVLQEAPATMREEAVLHALEDLSGVMSGRLMRLADLRGSLPAAISDVKHRLQAERTGSKQSPRWTDPSGAAAGSATVRNRLIKEK